MDALDAGHIVYMVILAVALLGWVIAENRRALGRTIRTAMAWAFIFVGVIAAYGLWSDIQDDILPRQAVLQDGARIEVPQSIDGHYYLTAELNGVPVDFVVDTGASEVVLTQEDAARIGAHPETLAFTGLAGTANGTVRIARIRVAEFALGGRADRNVAVSVNGGEMDMSLLGMSYLQHFDRIEIAGGRLVLER